MGLFRQPPFWPQVRARYVSTKGASRQGTSDATLADLTLVSAATLALKGSAAITFGNLTTASASTLLSQYTTDAFINNTGTILAAATVHWSWFPLGRLGSLAGITPVEGSGTTSGAGVLTVTGLASGAGLLMAAIRANDATDDAVYYEAGTAA